MRVLIVEDEVRLAEGLAQIMAEQRYQVDTVNNGMDGLDYALSDQYEVIVLDVMLPRLSGFEVARQLRRAHISTPILMLTAKDEILDKVTGLDCGADDYMTKPFAAEELLARLRALTRRQGEVVTEDLSFSDLTLHLSSRSLSVGENALRLGYKEFEIMRILLSNPKSVVLKESLILKVWGMDSDAEYNNVEVYISFLRKKLSFLGSAVSIGTMRKVGYFLEEAL